MGFGPSLPQSFFPIFVFLQNTITGSHFGVQKILGLGPPLPKKLLPPFCHFSRSRSRVPIKFAADILSRQLSPNIYHFPWDKAPPATPTTLSVVWVWVPHWQVDILTPNRYLEIVFESHHLSNLLTSFHIHYATTYNSMSEMSSIWSYIVSNFLCSSMYIYICCVQLPELANANVHMKNPDRVSAIIQSMIANGSQRLQVWSVISPLPFSF